MSSPKASVGSASIKHSSNFSRLTHKPSVLKEGSYSQSTVPSGFEINVSAPGKVILHGEHAVVYDKLAVAACLGLRTKINLVEVENKSLDHDIITLELPALQLLHAYDLKEITDALLNIPLPLLKDKSHFNWEKPELIDQPALEKRVEDLLENITGSYSLKITQYSSLKSFFFLFAGILGSLNLELKSFMLIVETELKISAGTGSSASYLVAIAALFIQYARLKMKDADNVSKVGYKPYKFTDTDLKLFKKKDLDVICKWAYHAEKIIHGTPSGLDNTICTYGSMVEFKRGSPPKCLYVSCSFKILLVHSGVPRNTKAMVQRVANLCKKHPKITADILNSIEETTKSCVACVLSLCKLNENNVLDNDEYIAGVTANYNQLGDLADINHNLLNALDVSHEKLDKIRKICLKSNLHGKMTGAGGGGYFYCFIPPFVDPTVVDQLIDTLNSKGFEASIAELGGVGVTVD